MSDANTKRDKLLESIADQDELDGLGEGSDLYNHVKSGYSAAYTIATKLESSIEKYNSIVRDIKANESLSTKIVPDGAGGGVVGDRLREITPPTITTGGTFQNKLSETSNTVKVSRFNKNEIDTLIRGMAFTKDDRALVQAALSQAQEVLSQAKEVETWMDEYNSISSKVTAPSLAERGGVALTSLLASAGNAVIANDLAAREIDALVTKKKAALASIESGLNQSFDDTLNQAFKEQCFIQRYVYQLVEQRLLDPDLDVKLPYEEGNGAGFNRPITVQGSPFGFINGLTVPRSTQTLFELPNSILSQLQPHIRLYKVDENGNEIPIEFESSILKNPRKDIDSVLKTSKRRGHGAGLKSFNFAFEGTDPFTIKKSITAKLTIAAASFEELLDDRGGYAYADLALKTGTSLMEQNVTSDVNSDGVIDNLDKLKFRLKAVVGYSSPPNLHIPSSLGIENGSTLFKDAIKNSFVTLNLTPTIHEFKFDETGRVNFSIDYLAYVEDFFDNAHFNVFSDIRTTADVYRRKVLRKYYESTCNLKEIDRLKKNEEKLIPFEQRNALRSLIERLLGSNKMKAVEVQYDKLGNFVLDPLIDPVTLISNNPKPDPTNDEQITYFYFYDLIQIAMDNIENSLKDGGYPKVLDEMQAPSQEFKDKEKKLLARMRDNFKDLRVVLGPIEIRDPANSSHYRECSIADIPISLNYFAEWMTQKVISRDRVEYNLSRFINDFIKSYLRNFLNDATCYGGASKQRVSFFSSNITSYKNAGSTKDEITQRIIKDRKAYGPENLDRLLTSGGGIQISSLRPLLNIMGSRAGASNQNPVNKDATNYMIFYAGRTRPRENFTGDRIFDQNNGIYHYILGRDRGIVKNINLTRTKSTGLKELRFEQEGFDGLQQLREVYDAEIKTFAYPGAFPGTYIFVEPRGFAPETQSMQGNPNEKITQYNKYDLTKYGIGGYFMIIRSEHNFAEGIAETSITAKWVAEANPDGEPPPEGGVIGNSNSGTSKCRTRHSKQNVQIQNQKNTKPEDSVSKP
tara:strand:+ start:8671 stop:11754 length:3084 start_codon:yes stop_codon:yes gene_type:complete